MRTSVIAPFIKISRVVAGLWGFHVCVFTLTLYSYLSSCSRYDACPANIPLGFARWCQQRPTTAPPIPQAVSYRRSCHDRRRILFFNVTRHPTSSWIVQQLREAFPYQSIPKFVLFDHDAKYGLEVPAALRSMTITCVQTSIRSPWQNGVAERWVGSCRRDLLGHIIALNERHLRRLLADYVRYYHEDRTHMGLQKQTPGGRVRSTARGRVVSRVRLGGLHHRYDQAVKHIFETDLPRFSELESSGLRSRNGAISSPPS